MANRFEHKVRILDLIRDHRVVSRPMLSHALGISLPSISNLTKELIDERLIYTEGFDKSDGGRRAELLGLNPEFATAVGLELTLSGIRGVLSDLGGQVLHREELAGPVPDDPDAMAGAMLDLAKKVAAAAPEGRAPLGVGLGVAGLIDEAGRVSRMFPHRKQWQNVALAERLEKTLNLPARLINDVHAATLAELRYGSVRGLKNVMYLHIGKGIACGIIVNGRLYAGATRNAGEFGHTVCDPDGPVCYCGNYGCLESLASAAAVKEQTLQGIRKGVQSAVLHDAGGDMDKITSEGIYRAADEGDRLATNVVTKAAEYVGRALANLVNIFNPEAVVFGGEVLVRQHPVFNEGIRATFKRSVLPVLQHDTHLPIAALGHDASALGGAMCIFEDLFDDPETLFKVAHGHTPSPADRLAARDAPAGHQLPPARRNAPSLAPR